MTPETPLESLFAAAPVLLGPLLVVAAARGVAPPCATAVCAGLLFLWGATLAVTKKRARQRAARDVARQELEASVQRAVGMAETEDDVLDVVGQAIAQVVPGTPAEILLTDATGSEIHLAAIASAGAPGCPVDKASACPALRSGQTQSFAQTDALDLCPRLRARPDGPKPALCVPLSVMGRTIGVLHAITTKERPFRPDQVASLEGVATHLGSRLRMLQMVDELQKQATTDSLTSLPNRRSFEEQAARALRGRSAALAIADLDHFKRLNDAHGHAAGDRALRVFADSLRRTFARKGDIVARLGGEEFALVLPKTTAAEARLVFAQAQADLALALESLGVFHFTASYGVALAPDHGTTLTELLAAADRALYNAKASGRDRVTFVGDAPTLPTASLAPITPITHKVA